MAPVALSDTATVTETALASTKAQPVKKVEEVEKEVTPLEAISHGDVLPGKGFPPHVTARSVLMHARHSHFPKLHC